MRSPLDDLEIGELRLLYLAAVESDEDSATFPSWEDWLTNRRELGQTIQGAWRPTVAAVLLYGKSPQD